MPKFVQNKKDFMKKLNNYLKRNGVTDAPFDVNGEDWYIDFDEEKNTIYTGPKVDDKVVKKAEIDYDNHEGWPMSDILDDLYLTIGK